MLNLIQWIKNVTAKIRHDNVSAFAAQSAYFIILSFFPFIMFVMTLIRFLPIDIDALVNAVISIIPSSSVSTVSWLLNEAMDKSSGTLLSLTIITLLWTAGKGIMAIARGLNAVNDIDESRNYFILRILATIYTLLFAIMILFTLAFLVFGNRLYLLIVSYFPMLNNIAAFVINIRRITAFILLTFFFACFYKVLPSKKMKFLHQIPGALFSSAGWLVFSYFFSIYVDFSKNISYMYGSLAGIILLMLCLYLCMYIMFFGAELNILIFGKKEITKGLRY